MADVDPPAPSSAEAAPRAAHPLPDAPGFWWAMRPDGNLTVAEVTRSGTELIANFAGPSFGPVQFFADHRWWRAHPEPAP